jgi:hypothetical protein
MTWEEKSKSSICGGGMAIQLKGYKLPLCRLHCAPVCTIPTPNNLLARVGLEDAASQTLMLCADSK